MNEDKKRRGHPAYPPEEKRVTISCRIHPSTKAFLKQKGLKPGRVLDRAVATMKKSDQ
jgi:hypothetical protein